MDDTKGFSVLMSVYKNDSSLYLERAVASVLNQTLPPNEVVLVIDGPVDHELDLKIREYEDHPSFKVVRLSENVGLGMALNQGLDHCSYDLVARMDSDDICRSNRFELQYHFLLENPTVDIVGSNISEFIGEEDNIVSFRKVPQDNQSIRREMKFRCALNHVTVMFRREAVLKAGGYQHLFWNEDYYLWIRMLLSGANFGNIPEPLVNVRIGEEMFARRGGYKYFQSEIFLQKFMLKHNLINYFEYAKNSIKRFIVQLLLPNSLRGYIFKKFARDNKS